MVIYGIWLLVLGVVAIPSLIIAKRPDAKEMIAKLTPYQGWIGAVSCIWGIWGIISCVLNLSLIGASTGSTIWWATLLAGSILQASLGLILGIGTLKSFIKDPTAQAKMDETLAKLSPKQGMLGVAAIGVGLWEVVASLILL